MTKASTYFAISLLTAFIAREYLCDIVADNIDLWANELLIKGYLPDVLVRFGIRLSLKQRLKELNSITSTRTVDEYVNSFVDELKQNILTAEAAKQPNEQHYEILGFHNKYSAIYLTDTERQYKLYTNPPSATPHIGTLDQSEVDMFNIYIERAELCIGDNCDLNVLDLGCGWGSFSLYYASRCPSCTIVSVSNSQSQIAFIQKRAKELDLNNVVPRKVNVNELETQPFNVLFDRIISIEMFEHMKNYQALLHNLKHILKCDGKLFVHMFVHKDTPYHFESGWMAQYFFTGGTMPSHGMLSKFDDDFTSVDAWKVNGKHYSYTLETWLQKMDMNIGEMKEIIGNIYGKDPRTVTKWIHLWRTFFMACSELFNMFDGNVWFVGHYLLEPKC